MFVAFQLSYSPCIPRHETCEGTAIPTDTIAFTPFTVHDDPTLNGDGGEKKRSSSQAQHASGRKVKKPVEQHVPSADGSGGLASGANTRKPSGSTSFIECDGQSQLSIPEVAPHLSQSKERGAHKSTSSTDCSENTSVKLHPEARADDDETDSPRNSLEVENTSGMRTTHDPVVLTLTAAEKGVAASVKVKKVEKVAGSKKVEVATVSQKAASVIADVADVNTSTTAPSALRSTMIASNAEAGLSAAPHSVASISSQMKEVGDWENKDSPDSNTASNSESSIDGEARSLNDPQDLEQSRAEEDDIDTNSGNNDEEIHATTDGGGGEGLSHDRYVRPSFGIRD